MPLTLRDFYEKHLFHFRKTLRGINIPCQGRSQLLIECRALRIVLHTANQTAITAATFVSRRNEFFDGQICSFSPLVQVNFKDLTLLWQWYNGRSINRAAI